MVNLILIKAFDEASFPKSLKMLLKNDNVWFFGRQTGRDLIPFLDMVQFFSFKELDEKFGRNGVFNYLFIGARRAPLNLVHL